MSTAITITKISKRQYEFYNRKLEQGESFQFIPEPRRLNSLIDSFGKEYDVHSGLVQKNKFAYLTGLSAAFILPKAPLAIHLSRGEYWPVIAVKGEEVFTIIFEPADVTDGEPAFGKAANTTYYLLPPTETPSEIVQDNSFTFFINPESVSVERKKLTTQTNIKPGYIWQYWGNDTTTVIMSGKTGPMNTTKQPPEATPVNITDIIPVTQDTEALRIPSNWDSSQAWVTFMTLLALYRGHRSNTTFEDDQLLSFIYQNTLFIGHFTDFSYDDIADDPLQLSYNFTFAVDVPDIPTRRPSSNESISLEDQIAKLKQLATKTKAILDKFL